MTVGITSTCSVLVFNYVSNVANGNNVVIVFSVIGVIIVGAIFCTICDVIRRRAMVERPVSQILKATEKIASGDFSVRLIPNHDYLKYDEYDLIYENINTLATELSKNELLKNDFISNVSHEIKTPLAVIQNYAQSLNNKKLDDKKKEEYIKGLVEQTKKLSDLISNILKLNKLENQKIVAEKEKFNLSELVRTTTLQFEEMIENKGLDLECDIDEIEIVSYQYLLEIVLNNLISNAIKFTNQGKIFISLKKQNQFVVVKVKDTGIGMDNEVGQHIFDKFYQGDKSRSTEGNGLGLALVKKVIDTIGGEISVESKVGVGTTFTIKLKQNINRWEMKKKNDFEFTYIAPTSEERKEIESIRRGYVKKEKTSLTKLEYLRKLDWKVKNIPTAYALIAGILGLLIFGLGMAMVLEWYLYVWGVIVAAVGVVPMGFANFINKKTIQHYKDKYSEEILRISDELLNTEEGNDWFW